MKYLMASGFVQNVTTDTDKYFGEYWVLPGHPYDYQNVPSKDWWI